MAKVLWNDEMIAMGLYWAETRVSMIDLSRPNVGIKASNDNVTQLFESCRSMFSIRRMIRNALIEPRAPPPQSWRTGANPLYLCSLQKSAQFDL
jgi:hypothetical protein